MTGKYHIKPKRDFGGRPFLINGEKVMTGFVVVAGDLNIVNVMPGATWFRNIPCALRAISILKRCGGTGGWQDKIDGEKFWALMREGSV